MPLPFTPERLAANRANARRSSGPRTSLGKSISRCNSFKHGLTGEGIVLADEDVAAVEERFAAFEADLKPANGVASAITRRAAILSVRMERCVREEAANLNRRMLEAPAIEEEGRFDEIAAQIVALDSDPERAVRHLRRSPEGIDWMIATWLRLRIIMASADLTAWALEHTNRLKTLLGHRPSNRPVVMSAEERPRMVGLIDGEVERLRSARSALDLEAIERSRSEAATRAIFDGSKAGELARKYEAAAERGFYRALREVERINEAVRKGEEDEACVEVGSSEVPPEAEPSPARPVSSIGEESPQSRDQDAPLTPQTGPEGVDPAVRE